jgi:hypothetical protein
MTLQSALSQELLDLIESGRPRASIAVLSEDHSPGSFGGQTRVVFLVDGFEIACNSSRSNELTSAVRQCGSEEWHSLLFLWLFVEHLSQMDDLLNLLKPIEWFAINFDRATAVLTHRLEYREFIEFERARYREHCDRIQASLVAKESTS